MMNWLLKCSEVATKNTHPFSHKISLSKAKPAKSVPPTISTRPYWFYTWQILFQTVPTWYHQLSHRCHRDSVTNFPLRRFQESEFPSLKSVSPRFETHLGHRIGTTEIHISVSPRIQKLSDLVQLGTTEILFGVTELGNNVVTIGFLGMPIYTLMGNVA